MRKPLVKSQKALRGTFWITVEYVVDQMFGCTQGWSDKTIFFGTIMCKREEPESAERAKLGNEHLGL